MFRSSSWSLTAAALVISSGAFAQTATTTPPVISKDWKLDTQTCIASTLAKTKTASFVLEVAVDTTQARPVELRIIQAADSVPAVLAVRFALDKKTNYAFAPIVLPESAVTSFWNVPRGTQALLSYLKREAQFPVNLVDGSPKGVALSFSLRGSSAALAALQKQCNGNQDLAADAFERAFLPALAASVDPTKLAAADTAKLRDLLISALAAFRSSNASQAQLNALSTQYLAQITEYTKLRSNLDKLTNDTVVKLNARQAASQANIDKANAEIPQLQAQVTQQEAALSTANAALDAAKAGVAPFLPTLAQYQDAVDGAESDESAAETSLSQAQTYQSQTSSRLQQINDGIAQSQSAINSLRSTLNSLGSDLQSASNEVDRTRRIYNDAQSTRQRFNRDGEIRRRESSDWQLSSIESDLRNLDSQSQQARQRAMDALQQQRQAEDALRTCQATAGQDCSSQQSALSSAQSNERSARVDADSYAGRMNDLRARADRERQSICDDVDRQYNALLSTEQDAANKYSNAQTCLNDVQSKVNQITSIDLPQAQSNLSSWQSAQSGAQSDVNNAAQMVANAQRDVSNASDAVDRAESRMKSWKSSSGYNQKAAALDSAQSKVNDINSTLNHLDVNIAKDQKLIRDETKNLADVAAQMQAAVALIAQKQARSDEVQQLLAPYYQQRDALNASKAASDQAFKDSQTAYAAGLPQAT